MTKAEDCYKKVSVYFIMSEGMHGSWYCSQLAAVFCQLGKREAQHMASLLARKMKVGVRQEKQLSAVESRRAFRKYKSSPRRKIRTVSCPNTRLPAPKRKSAANQNKTGMWSPTCLQLHDSPPATKCPSPAAPPIAREPQDRGEVLANPENEVVEEQPLAQLNQQLTSHRVSLSLHH